MQKRKHGQPSKTPRHLQRINMDVGAVHRLDRSEHARRVNRILAEHGPEGLKMLRRP